MAKKNALKEATEFFYKHAGYSCDLSIETCKQARRRGAMVLAKAERDAASLGITFDWEQDRDPDVSWMGAEQNRQYRDGVAEMLVCTARDRNGKVVASLGGVHVLTGTDKERADARAYMRVVEAELALEAIG